MHIENLTIKFNSMPTTSNQMKHLFSAILLLCCIGCSNKNKGNQSANDRFELEVIANKELKIPISDNTKFRFPSLFPYIDTSGKEYLTFSDFGSNTIFFHDLQTGAFLFDVVLDTDGPHGVGKLQGYHIEDLNNIYISSTLFGLSKVDTSGQKKQFIEYKKTNKGHNIVPNFTSSSYIYTPAIIHKEKIYITQRPYRGIDFAKMPVSIAVDTTSEISFKELPFRFPEIKASEGAITATTDFDFSREYNGKQLIYSFHMDKNIYVTDIETNEERIIPAQSKYISKLRCVKHNEGDIEKLYEEFLENSYYHNILYDKYRNVYYRFAIIGGEIEKTPGYKFFDIYTNGFIQFSVITLDCNFNIIGETLFPKYTYNPTIAFVHKDGLYISDSHILNPNFNENNLSFKCFTLKEK